MMMKRWCLLPLAAFLLLSFVPAVTEVLDSMSDCDQFLLNGTSPQVPGILEGGNILKKSRYKPICQTFDNVRRFVTLYDTQNKIPVFSAYKFRGENETGRPDTPWKIEPQTGRVDPQHPRVCGHSGRVLDVKWNPFDDHCVASCSEDCTVLLWDVSQVGAVLRYPVRVVLMPIYNRYPSDTLLLSVSFNSDGSRLAVTSKDRRVRVLDPRTGTILQVSSSKSHRASKVLYIGGLKMLLSTGSSPWNHRQIVLWDPDDLSEPLHEEDLDGSAGVLFPFYDPDTHMLYLAGKGDGNIRYYELSTEKPYISFLAEYRSLLPQKGLGVMPKRGLDVSACEVFRFYRLIAIKDLVEPLSMIVPRKESGIFQEDLYPMTAGNQAAMTAQEWLMGINRGPVLMSLKPGTQVANPYPETPAEKGLVRQLSSRRFQMGPAGGGVTGADLDFMVEAFLEEQLAYQDAKYPREVSDLSGWQPDETQIPLWTYCCTPHCCEPAERPPPTTESELLQAFYRQQDEIRDLREQLNHKDERITQLELQIKNTRNNMRATF